VAATILHKGTLEKLINEKLFYGKKKQYGKKICHASTCGQLAGLCPASTWGQLEGSGDLQSERGMSASRPRK